MSSHQNIPYTGARTKDALIEFCKSQSIGCYILYSTVFGEAVVTKYSKLPSSAHAASDYPNGYFRNGEHCVWSEARVIAAQNAGQTRD